MPRRTILPDARVNPRFSGISTFCRYPRLEDVAPENAPVDWAIYGVPFDGGVTYRPGARFGPRAVRDASQYIKRYSLHHDIDLTQALSLADAGDAPVSPYDSAKTLDLVDDFACTLGDAKHTKLMAVGGDHSVAYANIRATYTRRGEPAGGLAVIHFDSHLDTVDEVWGSKWGHASPFRRAIEEGLVNPAKMISIGIKGPLNSGDDLGFAKQHGVAIVSFDDVRGGFAGAAGATGSRGERMVRDYLTKIGTSEAYISFDVDVVDPAFAPGTGTPAVGGFTSAEALDALRFLKGVKIAGGDVVEVLPDRDVSDITALLAGQVMFEILALDAAAR